MKGLYPTIAHDMASMLYEVTYVSTLKFIRECEVADNEHTNFEIVINSDEWPQEFHIGSHNNNLSPKEAAVIPEADNRELGRRYIVLRRHGRLNFN